MSSNLQEVLAQINSGQAKRTGGVEKKALKTKVSNFRSKSNEAEEAPTVSSSVSPSDQHGKTSSMKAKLKGSHNGYTTAVTTQAPAAAVSTKSSVPPVSIRISTTAVASAASAVSKSGVQAVRGTAPISMRLKMVQDYLREHVGEWLSAAEILSGTGQDLAADDVLLQRLKAAPFARIQDDDEKQISTLRIKYRPHNEGIRDKPTLLNFIREHPNGTYREYIEDSYKGVLEDLNVLQSEQRIFVINNPEAQQDAVFPAELMDVKVDDDIIAHFHQVEVPRNDVLELQQEVTQTGLKSALASQELKRPAPMPSSFGKDGKKRKPRKERAVNINKVTNAHLPGLFAGAAPKSLDER
ncbi:hypothetical protein CEUSTIGMA_g11420.t1 [Chlamydomonas eustigma]|uniref:TFA2 Winged helix domain-containing protein n=1 Tax=Chlamydomonas eustigma TaxID=1157962 RepID=A0A250XLL5_9CHLO|nr:hypothetical protein CEUSTIGMA_g11420.t1 [Chlamydomonas eustigma]|eukprot:GAX83995.1 hypothetical protein CEUSTIGMA_g11420.t1 [Chlamydomonas eustigma]